MKDSLLFKCILASAALHAVSLVIFFAKPLHFYPNFFTYLGKNSPTPLEEENIRQGNFLEESLREFIVASPQMSTYRTVKMVSSEAPPQPIAEKTFSYENPFLFPSDQEIATPKFLPIPPLEIASDQISAKLTETSVTLHTQDPSIQPLKGSLNPFEDLAIPLNPSLTASEGLLDFQFLPSQEKFQIPPPLYPTLASPKVVETTIVLSQAPLSEQEVALSQKPTPFSPVSLRQQPSIAAQQFFPSLASYGIPELTLLDWNEIFEVDIKTVAREEGGYLFSLTFLPKVDLTQHRLKQNYYFLIDRSNSIEKQRYQSFKRAVLRAIASLNEGDHFNVIIFDAKIASLSETTVVFNKKNQRLAEEFLERQPYGNYGAVADLYASLNKIIPSDINEEEAHTAILISDGDSKLKPEKQRSLINSWLTSNHGKVVLYTAAVGKDNNLSALELLGTASRGSFLYSDTHTGFPRKLAKLILTLRSPIAKELSFSVTSSDPAARLQLFPSSTRLPYLFSDHPFVLYGTADKLSDFTVTLEGRNKDQLLTIKKSIAFAKAKPGNRLLAKQWAAQQAHLFYEQYLQQGKPALLEEAQKLLSDESTNPRR